ncbi:MAG: VWA domain-containing protein [Ignavibacteria bacterium]|nr:VWA domain-containing protein [Ignavibacteria bacterium]
MRFAHPEYLYLFVLLGIAIIAIVFNAFRKRRIINKLLDKAVQEAVIGQKSYIKEYLKQGVLILSIACIILAFANPQIGTRLEEVKQVGIDVMICLDVSMSMNAEDLKPSRLELAKREISDLMKRLHGDRIGLIVFAGEAYVQFPLTSDYSAANLFLNAVDAGTVPQPGTAIASAITLAGKSFDKNKSMKKVIIVITDGEDHEGNVSSAVKDARENGSIVYAIGMGSPTGSPIPLYNEKGQQVGFKTDQSGNTVVTKLDETILMQLAGEGGGKYYLSSSAGTELQLIMKDLSSIEKSEYGSKKMTDFEDKFYYFLLPGLILLIVELFMTDIKSPWFTKFLNKLRLRG